MPKKTFSYFITATLEKAPKTSPSVEIPNRAQLFALHLSEQPVGGEEVDVDVVDDGAEGLSGPLLEWLGTLHEEQEVRFVVDR